MRERFHFRHVVRIGAMPCTEFVVVEYAKFLARGRRFERRLPSQAQRHRNRLVLAYGTDEFSFAEWWLDATFERDALRCALGHDRPLLDEPAVVDKSCIRIASGAAR